MATTYRALEAIRRGDAVCLVPNKAGYVRRATAPALVAARTPLGVAMDTVAAEQTLRVHDAGTANLGASLYTSLVSGTGPAAVVADDGGCIALADPTPDAPVVGVLDASGTFTIQRNGELPTAMHRIPSVRDFGALGDGTTDDSDAFEAAMTQALPDGRGHLLFVPPGLYILNRDLRFRGEIHLLGAGGEAGNATTQLFFGADAGIVVDSQSTARPFGGGSGYGSIIEGFRIAGTIKVVPSIWEAGYHYSVGDRVHMWIELDATSHKKLLYRSFYWECVRDGTTATGALPPAINSATYASLRIPYADHASVPEDFPSWQANHSYHVGDYVSLPDRYDFILQCTSGGTSGSVPPNPTAAGASVSDGATVTWFVRSAYLYFYDEGAGRPAWAARVHAGIRAHAFASVKHCFIENFVNAGLWIEGDVSPDGPGGNAIGWFAQKLTLAGTGIGIFVRGTDAHAGTALNCKTASIGLIQSQPLSKHFPSLVKIEDEDGACAFCDRSYYGNSWNSCVAEDSTDRSFVLESTWQSGIVIGCWDEGSPHLSYVAGNNVIIGGWSYLQLARLDPRSTPAAVQAREFREVWEVNRLASLKTTAKLHTPGTNEVFLWTANTLDGSNDFGWRHNILGYLTGDHEWGLSYNSGAPTPFFSIADGFAADGTFWRDHYGHFCGIPGSGRGYFFGVGANIERSPQVRRGRRDVGDRFEAGVFSAPRGKYLGRIVTAGGYRAHGETWTSIAGSVGTFNEAYGSPPRMIETASGKVFACVRTGIVGTSEPSWAGATVPSPHFGPSSWIKAWTPGGPKILGWRVRPSTPNATYYVCTRAGVTGPSEPAVWPTSGSIDDPDANGVEWTVGGADTPAASLIADGTVLWEYLGTLPQLADYAPVYEKGGKTITDGATPTTTTLDSYPIDADGVSHFDVVVTAYRTDAGSQDGMSFVLRGAWNRVGTAAAVSLGTVAVDSRGTAAWTATLALAASNTDAEVRVTGAGGATIVWNSTRRPR